MLQHLSTRSEVDSDPRQCRYGKLDIYNVSISGMSQKHFLKIFFYCLYEWGLRHCTESALMWVEYMEMQPTSQNARELHVLFNVDTS